MGSPAIFAGSRTKLLSSAGLVLKDGAIVDNDGPQNFIDNGHAEVNALGWATYFDSDAVTFQDTGDTVTLNNHGLTNGTPVAFTVITTTTGISVNTTYYVVGATTNTFQVASAAGGSALPLTNNGTGTLVVSYPINGTGGSANITWTRTTTTPLAGAASFLFTKDAASRMGQGASYDFTVSSAYQARVMNISFDYIVASGTFAAGSQTSLSDVTVYIYDVTNSVLIQPSIVTINGSSTSLANTYTATFQTSATGTSYRLIFHCATTSSSAFGLEIDNVVVTPANYTYGSPVTDWVSYTPGAATAGFGTLASVDLYYRRVGGNMEIRGSFNTGTTSATEARLALPLGLTTTTDVNQNTQIGVYGRGANSSNHGGLVLKQNAVNYILFSDSSTFSNTAVISTNPANGSSVAATGEKISLQVSVPIAGWASNVQIADPYTNRMIAASYWVSTNFAASTTVPINFDSREYDTTASVTTSSTAWRFTAPAPGYYALGGFLMTSAGATIQFAIYKNGTAYKNISSTNSTTPYRGQYSTVIFLNTNDFIDVRPNGSATVQGGALAGGDVANISISRLSDPSILAASEVVSAAYRCSANFAASATVPINFDTRIFDTHNAVAPSGTAWVFRAPYTAFYSVQGFFHNGSGTSDVGNYIHKNGSATAFQGVGRIANTTYLNFPYPNTMIYLLAGETIDFRPGSNVTYSGGALNSGTTSYVCITKVGP